MVITDEYSRFPVVEVVRYTAAEPIISCGQGILHVRIS